MTERFGVKFWDRFPCSFRAFDYLGFCCYLASLFDRMLNLYVEVGNDISELPMILNLLYKKEASKFFKG